MSHSEKQAPPRGGGLLHDLWWWIARRRCPGCHRNLHAYLCGYRGEGG